MVGPSPRLQVVGVVSLCVLGALAWVGLLHRRVREQTAVIRRQLETLTLRETDLQEAQEHLQRSLAREHEAGTSDFLTGLRNRRAFAQEGESEVRRAERHRRPIALACINLDNFKAVNDAAGHDSGGRVLVTVASTIRETVRATDVAARLGGDEFAVLLPETGPAAARVVMEKLNASLLEAMRSASWPVTVSIGTVVRETAPASFEELLGEADSVMYSMKKDGKNKSLLIVRDARQ